MLDELNKIKKEEFEIINTYIKENIDDLNISINDEEAELASLNEEIRQKLLSGEYSDISNLSIEANKVDKERNIVIIKLRIPKIIPIFSF